MITAHADVPVAIRAMREGAYEFIEKPVDSRHLLDVVRRAFDVSVARLRDQAAHDSIRQRYESLSAREAQVLAAMVDGRLTKQIGSAPGTSQHTDRGDRAKLMEKISPRQYAEHVILTIRLDGLQDRPG